MIEWLRRWLSADEQEIDEMREELDEMREELDELRADVIEEYRHTLERIHSRIDMRERRKKTTDLSPQKHGGLMYGPPGQA